MDVRADAIAKLKRAASLPRLRDGRRPVVDTQQNEDGDLDTAAVGPARSLSPTPAPALVSPEPPIFDSAAAAAHQDDDIAAEGEPANEPDVDPESDAAQTAAAAATPTKKRGLVAHVRVAVVGKIPVTRLAHPARPRAKLWSTRRTDSTCALLPPRIRPSSHNSKPRHITAASFAFLPANVPSPVLSPGPGSSALPSIDAIRNHLSRSNSAAARNHALYKLTGVKPDPEEIIPPAPEPATPSPPQATPFAALGRSNTTGGARMAGRAMIHKLTLRRANPGAPTDQEMSGEEVAAQAQQELQPRRNSWDRGPRPTIVDDREFGPAVAVAQYPEYSPPESPIDQNPRMLLRMAPIQQSLSEPDVNDRRGPSPAVSTTHMLERDRDSALARLVGEDHFEYDIPSRRAYPRRIQRGPVIEDNYEDGIEYGTGQSARRNGSRGQSPDTQLNQLSLAVARVPHASNTDTHNDIDETMDQVPLYLRDTSIPSPYRQDAFPISAAFGTPRQERGNSEIELDHTHDSYVGSSNAGLIVPYTGLNRQQTPSWQTFPEPLYTRESESEDDLASPVDPMPEDTHLGPDGTFDYGQVINTSYRDDAHGDIQDAHYLPDDRGPSRKVEPGVEKPTLGLPRAPARPESVDADWDHIDTPNELTLRDPATVAAALAPSSPPSVWVKLKSGITRNDGSLSPVAHSRSGSRAAGHTSQLSTDSVASSSSGRVLIDVNAQQQYVPPTQTSSAAASATMLPLASPASFTGASSASPIPLVSPADRAKYADSKLQPFPALAAMARQRGLSISQSSPDISLFMTTTASGRQTPVSPSKGQFEDADRPSLFHQSSDSKLVARYQQHTPSPGGVAPPSAFAPHAGRPGLHDLAPLEYIDLPISPQPKSASSNRSGKFRWMQKMRGGSASSINVEESRPGKQRKPSIVDLFGFKKPESSSPTNGNGVDRRQISNPMPFMEPSVGHAATTLHPSGAQAKTQEAPGEDGRNGRHPSRDMHNGRGPLTRFESDDTTPSSSDVLPRTSQSDIMPDSESPEDSLPSAPHSTTGSFASPQSERSISGLGFSPKASGALLKFESLLASGPLKIMESPPRKLLFMSAVSQVVNVNTVKNRVLFLFNDILIIAQPAVEDESPSASGARPLLDRLYEVRNVVELHRMRFCPGREDDIDVEYGKGIVPRQSDVQLFIREFSTDPDAAVAWLCSRAGIRDSAVALGRFLFETVELERGVLGQYLAERENRAVLKAFIDCFGFAGVRVDTALRIFLLALGLPTSDPPATEMLLGVFASRWFDLNSGLIAYDKELTIRLVRSIVSLNDAMHPYPESYYNGYQYPPPSPQISARHFIDACRQYDPSGLIGDDVLAGVYRSIMLERLRFPGSSDYRLSRGSAPLAQIKADGLPTRLTYRVASEPILVRISYPDPTIVVHLQGKDLLFDPPVLLFDKSREASFRVTSTSLGVKSIIMYYAGSRAGEYSGLPLSTNVRVERAYMKPVFQVAFPSNHGPRKYMFSVDDNQVLQDWMLLLRLHVSTAADAQLHRSRSDNALYQASEAVAIEAMRACIGTTYRGHKLVILAQQNSVIPSVLSMLKGA
ncbi:hypothetical protein BKA62DRAFT_764292 [Auriculariales sp. MPI-PUGE-AT-0066]|nr:hypothetical protein BKA62DRAFT_764292 [Auriculariales sp. MPI-PUGE-AT-0066]